MVTKPNQFLSLVNQQSPDDPSQQHLLYLKHYEQIKTVLSLYQGIDEAKDYIFQFPQETKASFDIRKNRATLRNFVKRAVEAFVGMIFRKPIQIDNFPPRTEKLFAKIDTKNDIRMFTKMLTESATRDGKAYILADAPSESSGGRPYLLIVDRLSVINWRKDEFGNFTMVVIEEWVSEPYGMFGTRYRKQWRHYQLNVDGYGKNSVTITLWRDSSDMYDIDAEGVSQKSMKPNTGHYIHQTIDTEFESIPLIEVSVDNVPLLYDTAKMNIKHLNRQSHKDRYLTMAALPIPVIWGADIDDDGKTTTAKPALVIGVDEAFIFTGSKDESDFQWRELSGTSIQALEDDLNSITEDITTGILRAAETASAVQKTATEVQLLQAEASNRVTTIANAVEIGMNEALIFLADINKETISPETVFVLSKDFNASLMGSDGARVIMESYLMGMISMETFLQTLSDMELISIGTAADEIERIKADKFKPEPKAPLPDDTDNRTKGVLGGAKEKDETKSMKKTEKKDNSGKTDS